MLNPNARVEIVVVGEDVARFWSHVRKPTERDTGQCWTWMLTLNRDGYGSFCVFQGNKQFKHPAHRVAWVIEHGTVPDGLFVCHRCDNPACVRPDHLFVGTNYDNVQDRNRKGRQARGMQVARWRWHKPPQVVSLIRKYADGATLAELADEFGIRQRAVWNIVSGKTWKQIPRPNGNS